MKNIKQIVLFKKNNLPLSQQIPLFYGKRKNKKGL